MEFQSKIEEKEMQHFLSDVPMHEGCIAYNVKRGGIQDSAQMLLWDGYPLLLTIDTCIITLIRAYKWSL